MIELWNIQKTYGTGAATFTALHEVAFKIRENEFFTLLGPSGCGKTTLLRLMAGFEMPTAGSVLLDGFDISHLPPNKRPVNTVFQNYALFPHMTVAQNIAFGLESLKKRKVEVKTRVEEMLDLVQMTHLRHRPVQALSGGQQQRVALARALAPNPKILLLDEPLSALDLKLRKEMQVELKRLQHETGITFIFVTHDQEEAMAMSDRIAVMRQGRVHQIATPSELYNSPVDRFVASFIGESNFLPTARVSHGDDVIEVQIEGLGALSLPKMDTLQDGSLAMVRPEHIMLGTPSAGVTTKGRVASTVYLGNSTQYGIRGESGIDFSVRVQNSLGANSQLNLGDEVTLGIPSNAIRLVQPSEV